MRSWSEGWQVTMPNNLVRAIRGRWHNPVLGAIAAVAVAMFATWGRAAAADPLAELKSGVAALEAQRYAAAIATLKPLAASIPKLSDYAAWFLASAEFGSGDYAAVPKTLEPVW